MLVGVSLTNPMKGLENQTNYKPCNTRPTRSSRSVFLRETTKSDSHTKVITGRTKNPPKAKKHNFRRCFDWRECHVSYFL